MAEKEGRREVSLSFCFAGVWSQHILYLLKLMFWQCLYCIEINAIYWFSYVGMKYGGRKHELFHTTYEPIHQKSRKLLRNIPFICMPEYFLSLSWFFAFLGKWWNFCCLQITVYTNNDTNIKYKNVVKKNLHYKCLQKD